MADRYEDVLERAIMAMTFASGIPEVAAAYDFTDAIKGLASALREQDTWWPIDDPEHPAPRDGSPFVGGVWLRADQRWHCTITGWVPWWNKDGCPFDIWSPIRLPAPPLSGRKE